MATVPHVYSGALLHGLFANEFCGRRDLRIALKFIRYPHEGFWILPQYIPKRLAAVFADIFYGPQQEVENESKHLAQIILQCTPKERMLIAAIVDTILDVRQRECGLGETEEL